MKIVVFGLGYVGSVTACCLAREGHEVVGVDISESKVDMINAGTSPIVEDGLEALIREAIEGTDSGGSLRASTDAGRAVSESEVSLICVGTPSARNGSLELDYVRKCATEIGEGIRARDAYHIVVARSTMLPGTCESVIVPEIEYASGKRVGRDFGIAVNPEFIREGTAIQDFYNPPVTVVGALDDRSASAVRSVYDFLDTPIEVTDLRSAEMVKYACNAFHAIKVVFGNEIGTICKALDIDSHRVMDAFCMDTKLNLSRYYLRPGFAYGGSCLPKDLRALTYKARELDVEVPMLSSIEKSNDTHVERAVQSLVGYKKKRLGVLGLSFKAGTDDLRESPLVRLVEALLGKGFDIRIYDRNVSIARLVGANKDYIEREIPHISSLMCEELSDVVDHGDVLLIGNSDDEFANVVEMTKGTEKLVFDLVRVGTGTDCSSDRYEGICW